MSSQFTAPEPILLKLLAFASLPVLLLGCNPPVSPDQNALRMLGPAAVRIHDSTKIVQTSAGGDFDGLSVACEVKDGFGDPIKTVGVMRFELYAFAPSQPENRGIRVGFWPDLRLDSNETIREHWDKTFGLFRFKLDWGRQLNPDQRFVLEAVLITHQGSQFTDTKILHVPSDE